MRRGMAVAANEQKAGQGDALLWPDHVHDALTRIAELKRGDAVARRVRVEGVQHPSDGGVGHVAGRTPQRRHIVIGYAEGLTRTPDCHPARVQIAEGVKRPIMDDMTVDINRTPVAALGQHMAVPDFLVQRTCADRICGQMAARLSIGHAFLPRSRSALLGS